MFVLKCQINFYKLDPGQTVEKLNIYLQVKYSYIKQYKQSTEIGNPPSTLQYWRFNANWIISLHAHNRKSAGNVLTNYPLDRIT